jgi:TPR repeat protein
MRKTGPNLAGLDQATGFADRPAECLKRMKALFDSGAIVSESEPDLAALERAHALLLASPAEGLEAMNALAERGSLMSLLYIAEAYRTGISGKPDPAQSADWYQRASNAGSAHASYMLGRMYLRTREYFNAKQWFEVGVRLDYTPAICMMGYMYAYGLGVRKDWDKARELLERASAHGHLHAKVFLASMLIRRRWGWLQVVRGLWMACAALINVLVDGSNSPRQI